jgi:site-specific DNA-methyltransferase (adenine-specific)/adenine-specific DNA-methyltransferase
MTDQPSLPKTDASSQRKESRVDSFEFEPIKGYPMLNWKGKRPFTSTHYYPAQLKEVYGEPVDGWRNKIFWGDNLQIMSYLLKEYRGKIDLVYIDPPFDSKADYKKKIELRGMKISNDQGAFEEKQYTDIWTNDEYLQFMYDRLVLIRELMSKKASIYVHCDWHKNHHLRCLLDEIFGSENYVSQVIWKKLATPKAQSTSFGNIYDIILVYRKSSEVTGNEIKLEHDPNYIEAMYRYEDERGRYRLSDFTQAGQGEPRKFGDKILPPPAGKHWIWSQDKIDEAMKEGRIVFSKNGIPSIKRYLDDVGGHKLDDLWVDIKPMSSTSTERLDYPTQKPESLLERIITASSNPGDVIFDCFMGSGTTQSVALKLGRKFIGADINLGSIQTTTKRLLSIFEEISTRQIQANLDNDVPSTFFYGLEVYNVNHYDVFRNPIEAKDLLLDALEVQRLEAGQLFDGEKDGRLIKIMPVNRIATRADLSELITGFDYKAFGHRQAQNPGKPVEKITLVCMGHEPDLAAYLKNEVLPYNLDVEVVDILRDRQDLQFKRDSEANITIKNNQLFIEAFYPMNLLQKLSMQKENVTDWRKLVESIMIDWNYDGAVLQPAMVDIPEGNDLVKGKYSIPEGAGTIRVKITDLLSESFEIEVKHG